MEINPTYEWRVKQLKAVKRMLIDHQHDWTDAVYQDLHKDPTETQIAEIFTATNEIDYLLKNLKQWMEPQNVPSPVLFAIGFSSVMRKPLGKVLIIAPFNYPILLALSPLAGSLAGGNPAVIKPSELCPTVSALLAKLVTKYLEPSAVQGTKHLNSHRYVDTCTRTHSISYLVVQGSVPEVTELLKHNWGKVVFTGSERVGKIVAQATAKTLTPTVLELGGKSPVFVDETCPDDICGVANRIVWGKTFNAGQTVSTVPCKWKPS
jgi:acyl-CoA reductase-like NAD-dependent aldehyde dehydrogenase